MNEKELARFLGYLFSDASLRRKKNKHGVEQAEFSIECADLPIVEDFQQLCRKILKRKVGKIAVRKRNKNWRTTYSFYCKLDKNWRKFFFNFSPTFKTSPCKNYKEDSCSSCPIGHYKDTAYPNIKIPNFIFGDKNNVKNFLQAFTNSEGSVQLRVNKHGKWLEFSRFVRISTEHPTLLKEISKMLRILDIEHRFAPRSNPNSVIIQQKSSIKKFNELIGFMDGIHITPTGIWGNYEKSKILEASLETFNFDKGFLQRFSDANDVYSFIKVNHLPEMHSET